MSVRDLWGQVKFNTAQWWGRVTATETQGVPACVNAKLPVYTITAALPVASITGRVPVYATITASVEC